MDRGEINITIIDYLRPYGPERIGIFGSYARGDYRDDSDLDLLVLVDKDIISRFDQKRIKYPLYEIEFDTGTIISPLIFSRKDWEKNHRITPFYENVAREGRIL